MDFYFSFISENENSKREVGLEINILLRFFVKPKFYEFLLRNILEMTEGGGDSSTALVDVLDLAKNAISISGLKDAQVFRNLCI